MNLETLNQFIESDAEKSSGAPVFRGVRVSVKNLFDDLETDNNLNEFSGDFPTVVRARACGALELCKVKLFRLVKTSNARKTKRIYL
jgi:uncharacterized protein (DUF433 family)